MGRGSATSTLPLTQRRPYRTPLPAPLLLFHTDRLPVSATLNLKPLYSTYAAYSNLISNHNPCRKTLRIGHQTPFGTIWIMDTVYMDMVHGKQIDMNGKRNPWEAVNVLPFIDAYRLRAAVKELCPPEALTPKEADRNTRGQVRNTPSLPPSFLLPFLLPWVWGWV